MGAEGDRWMPDNPGRGGKGGGGPLAGGGTDEMRD